MRLLWLTDNYPPNRGGMAQSCDRIVHNLRQLGVYIDVVHLTQRVDKVRSEKVMHGEDISYPAHQDLAHSLNTMWLYLASKHQKEAYTHIVVFGGYFPMFAAPIFAAWMGAKVVTLIRGNDFDTGIFTPRKRQILLNCLEASSLVCSVCTDKLERINKLYPSLRTQYIPNGIDTSDWSALPSDQQKAQQWRNQHVGQDQKVIGLFGHLKDKKGVTFFLKSLCQMKLQESFFLLIVGDLSEEVHAFFQENQSLDDPKERLSYAHYPFMDRFELLSYYPACDVVAIPSFYDGLPNVLLEVGALGIPFIASDVAGMADVLEDEVHAIKFAPNDLASCRAALHRLHKTSKETLKEMGANCQQMIKEELTHTQEAQRYQEAFIMTL